MTNPELTRQHRHYGAVRQRLVGAATSASRSAVLARLEAEAAELARENAAHRRQIAALEADLADAEARLLAQAKALLSGHRSGADDGAGEERRSVEAIVASVLADFPGVSWDDIISVRRERRLVKPRHACMRAVYQSRPDLSLPRIGRIFRRDHSTVLAAVKAEPEERPASSQGGSGRLSDAQGL